MACHSSAIVHRNTLYSGLLHGCTVVGRVKLFGSEGLSGKIARGRDITLVPGGTVVTGLSILVSCCDSVEELCRYGSDITDGGVAWVMGASGYNSGSDITDGGAVWVLGSNRYGITVVVGGAAWVIGALRSNSGSDTTPSVGRAAQTLACCVKRPSLAVRKLVNEPLLLTNSGTDTSLLSVVMDRSET